MVLVAGGISPKLNDFRTRAWKREPKWVLQVASCQSLSLHVSASWLCQLTLLIWRLQKFVTWRALVVVTLARCFAIGTCFSGAKLAYIATFDETTTTFDSMFLGVCTNGNKMADLSRLLAPAKLLTGHKFKMANWCRWRWFMGLLKTSGRGRARSNLQAAAKWLAQLGIIF